MSTSVSAVSTVTEERKHELLMEARSSRLSWVRNSSPYQIDDDPQLTDATATKTNQCAMSILNSTNVARKIPSSIPVLEKLLEGKPIEELQDLTKPWRQKMLVKQHEQQSERLVHVLDDHAFVFCYEQILERLCMPESIDIVQGMRHFVRSFHDLYEKDLRLSPHVKSVDIDQMASSIQKYLESVYSSIASHPAWGGDNTHETKMMLETFVYSKCNKLIMNGLIESETLMLEKSELELSERLDFLDFVCPKHLEIHCIPDDKEAWKKLLSKPIMLLQSLNRMHSPVQMMRCILEVYRGVNEALKSAMKDGDNRMPSADDCLPTIILCMICAKPSILTNLKFLENFATSEQLRGEAGYAFTNLFSATQFIRELDLDMKVESDSSRPSLHITSEELKEKLDLFRESLNASLNEDVLEEKKPVMTAHEPDFTGEYHYINVPVNEVTAARLRGEDPVKWASEWAALKSNSTKPNLVPLSQTKADQVLGQVHKDENNANANLPTEGLARSYKFLATEPHDIRISDIPSLLDEYKNLIRTTEILLMERKTLLSKHHDITMENKKVLLDHTLAKAEATISSEKSTNVNPNNAL